MYTDLSTCLEKEIEILNLIFENECERRENLKTEISPNVEKLNATLLELSNQLKSCDEHREHITQKIAHTRGMKRSAKIAELLSSMEEQNPQKLKLIEQEKKIKFLLGDIESTIKNNHENMHDALDLSRHILTAIGVEEPSTNYGQQKTMGQLSYPLLYQQDA